MITRIVVGILAIPLVLLPIWLGGVWCLMLFLAVSLIGGMEFYTLAQRAGYRPVRALGLLWLAALVLSHWAPAHLPPTVVLGSGLILTLILALGQHQTPMHTWMSTSVGAIYLGTMLGQALALRQLPQGAWWIFFGLFITWINDTGAYFTGVTVGRHKLWPRLSPKKTWEGTVGGWMGAALSGGLFAWLMPLPLSVPAGVAIGFVCGVLALFGDLAVSMIKRQVGVKDSGRFFPGHGGMLDRLDSLLFVLPFVYYVALLWFGF
ncbi:phosphatidate cytidylyltransferase [Litorilinea aerophila]|uniref:phosphatidate cytidylyltransferase n=1 Tax=Litorilinea aerophila TaxID=1204385 RepID=UPI0014768744|nr:phosphatidate cytidylyltransferase [Litorilinea aerophila]MCC9077107.1 phosphatidate cytidylyltransferase [Litorilinea aerophila]GIV76149.1 MAG: phosphatidate cytidylyltransferase [Litorilinea sp.]